MPKKRLNGWMSVENVIKALKAEGMNGLRGKGGTEIPLEECPVKRLFAVYETVFGEKAKIKEWDESTYDTIEDTFYYKDSEELTKYFLDSINIDFTKFDEDELFARIKVEVINWVDEHQDYLKHYKKLRNSYIEEICEEVYSILGYEIGNDNY